MDPKESKCYQFWKWTIRIRQMYFQSLGEMLDTFSWSSLKNLFALLRTIHITTWPLRIYCQKCVPIIDTRVSYYCKHWVWKLIHVIFISNIMINAVCGRIHWTNRTSSIHWNSARTTSIIVASTSSAHTYFSL